MKRINIYSIWMMLLVSVVIMSGISMQSCSKQEIPYFKEADNSVRFPRAGEDNKEPAGYDEALGIFSVEHSFLRTPDLESFEYKLPVELIGVVSDKDLKVDYTVVEDATNAPESSYILGEGIIPAGKREGYISIMLKNSTELRSRRNVLTLKLKSSSDLKQGPEKVIYASISWSQMIPVPPILKDRGTPFYRTYNILILGSDQADSKDLEYFSPRALKLIVEGLNWYDWDDMDAHGTNNFNGMIYNNYKYLPRINVLTIGGQYKIYAKKLNDYLVKYRNQHPEDPVLHDAGKLKGQPVEVRLP